MIRFLAFGILVLATSSWAQNRPPIAEQTAKAYGLDSFGQIEGIRYTFNAEFPGVRLSHTWEWEPKTGRVTYEGKDKEGKPVKDPKLAAPFTVDYSPEGAITWARFR